MKPILYESTEAQFTSNGLGRLADCIDCTVTEERNGIYECQFSYPVTSAMYSQIQIGRILGVIHDDVKDVQPFDIYAKSAPLDGVVTFYAHHISYRLGHVILKPMEATSCAAAFAAIPANTYNNCPFTFWTDKAVAANWQNKTPSAVKAILGGQQGSILDVYGKGEYMWDRWLVRLYTNRGSDNGVSIRYGVNMTELQQELDDSGSYNAVAPYWVSREDGTVVTLTDGIVVYGGVQPSEPVVPVPMDLSDAFDVQPTETQLQTEALRRLTDSEAWLPSENITVSFVDLAGTEDYKSVSALQRVSLCDRVSVYCGPLGVSAVKMQVIRVVYNVLTERYDEIELGKAKATLAETITERVEEITRDLPTNSMMQQAIHSATEQITGAAGGHLLDIYDANGKRQEMLIMDTEDIATAVKLWRLNLGGLGFSRNGYAGPYALAITQNGEIVADFITTGHMSANRISGGVIDGTTVVAKLLNIVDGNGNVIASFDDTIKIGETTNGHVEIDYNSLELYDTQNRAMFIVGDMRNADGIAECHALFIGNGKTDRFFVQMSIKTIVSVSIDNTPTQDYSSNIKSIDFNTPPSDGSSIEIVYYTEDAFYRYDVGIRKNNSYIGAYSFASGYNNEASGDYSHAEGRNTTASGFISHAEGSDTTARNTYSHAEGMKTSALGINSHAEGYNTSAIGDCSHSEGYETTANEYSHAEGQGCEAIGDRSHAEGTGTTASESSSHAEGYDTTASGDSSHAEGSQTTASGYASHAEGSNTEASGSYSHASGFSTKASGFHSHASGCYTKATHVSQHVFGEFNIPDPSNNSPNKRGVYVEIVGNGFSESESNARTLDWNGNEWIAGALTVGDVPHTLQNLGIDPSSMVTGVKGNAESTYRTGDVNLTPANIGAVNKSGDTMNGTLTINNDSYSNGGFVRFWKDGEGGNIVIASPNGKEFQIDAFNNNRIRCYAFDDDGNIKGFEFDRTTGVVYASGGFDGTVKKSGDTMTGPLKWGSGTALPAASSLQYFLGIDPFSDGGTTHYITAANLLAAIGAVATSDIIDVAHGGTGATTPEDAQTNLEMFYWLGTATWSDIYSKLSNISGAHSAFVWLGESAVGSLLTGGRSDLAYIPGIVTKIGNNSTYRFALFKDGNTYSFSVSNLSASGGTRGTVYVNGCATKTVTATTDANGNISLALNHTNYVVTAVKASSFIVTPWASGSDSNWHARVTAVNGGAVASQSVTVTVYYHPV